MRLLVFSQYFWPEPFIINDLTRTLKGQGHHVVVATGKPNYPDGQIYDGYRESGTQIDVFAGDIPVYRVPLRSRRAGGGLNLVLNYLSFVWSGLRWMPSLLRGQSFDVILVFALSPVLMAIPAIVLRRRMRAHLVIWVQDLWPESLAATGHIRNRGALALVGVVVRWIYAKADTLLVQSTAFIEPVARLAARGKIVYYPNSLAAPEAPAPDDDALPVDLGETLRSSFCLVFAGNIGTAQAVETLVEAARLVADLPDVRLVFVGSGSRLAWVRERVAELALGNVVFAGRFPMDVMPQIYLRAQGLIVSLTPVEIFAYTVPSKVQAYLAAGRPIIASLNGEGARIVTEAGAGLTCPAGDAPALAACIRALRAMSDAEREALGASGRRYFREHFEIGRQAHRLIEILEQRLGGGGDTHV